MVDGFGAGQAYSRLENDSGTLFPPLGALDTHASDAMGARLSSTSADPRAFRERRYGPRGGTKAGPESPNWVFRGGRNFLGRSRRNIIARSLLAIEGDHHGKVDLVPPAPRDERGSLRAGKR